MATVGTANVYSCTNLISGWTTTATAASTTTLTSTSTYQQYFTGSSNQTVNLPAVTTLVTGFAFQIVNLSSGTLTVQTSASATITTVAASNFVTFTCINNSSNVVGSWAYATTSGSSTLNGDVTGPSASNTVVKINTQPVTATSNKIFWGYSGSAPSTITATGIGYQTLNTSTATTSQYGSTTNPGNTAIGHVALSSLTTGSDNTACGAEALDNATTASNLTAVGYQALASIVSGTTGATALGYQCLKNSTASNIAAGYQSMLTTTNGFESVALGHNSLQNSNVAQSVAVGVDTMNNQSPSNFVGIGFNAGINSPGNGTVAVGSSSYLTGVDQNAVAIGYNSLNAATTASYSVGTVGTGGVSSVTVTGVGTNWNYLSWPFAVITIGGNQYSVQSFDSPTSLTLFSAETVANGSTYQLDFNQNVPNIAVGSQAGSTITTGGNNTLIGGYTGNSAPISNVAHGFTVISDSVGTPKFTVCPNVYQAFNLPIIINSATYTQLATDATLVFTTTNCTITLLSAVSYPGLMIRVENITANSVTSASSDVVPMASTTAGTAILAAAAGRYALLQSNGVNWFIISSN